MAKKRDGLYRRKGSRFWWVRTDPLDGVPRSTGLTDLEAARLWRAARERLAADPAGAASAQAELGDWVDRVVAMKARDGSSRATVEVYEQKLSQVLRILGRDCRLSTIDTTKLDAYVRQRRDEGVSDHTIVKEWSCLFQLLNLAKRAKVYSHDLTTLRPPDLHAAYVPRKRVLTREEVVRLLATLKPSYAALVALCVALGCRRSEGLKLLPSDVDIEAGQVYVRGTKTDESDRYVPILSVFRSLVEQALPFLPLGLNAESVNRSLRLGCERAGIAHCSFNDLRRTHASLLLQAGVDRAHVARLLGHTTTALVDRVYGRLNAGDLKALAEPALRETRPVLDVQERDSVQELTSIPGAIGPVTTGTASRVSSYRASRFTRFRRELCLARRLAAGGGRRTRLVRKATTSQGYWAGRKAALT